MPEVVPAAGKAIATAPVLVGGVGGSGTRVVAAMLMKLGYFMGHPLNPSNDYLPADSLFPRVRELMREHGTLSNDAIAQHVRARLIEFASSAQACSEDKRYIGWGWKAPPNFFILEYVAAHFPGARYIHVLRHGLDMAFSTNQNQLRKWGFCFGIDAGPDPRPADLLKYWIAANRFAIERGRAVLNDRFFLLHFDRLCTDPASGIRALLQFLGDANTDPDRLVDCIRRPVSLGRYRTRDLRMFDPRRIECVADFGFTV